MYQSDSRDDPRVARALRQRDAVSQRLIRWPHTPQSVYPSDVKPSPSAHHVHSGPRTCLEHVRSPSKNDVGQARQTVSAVQSMERYSAGLRGLSGVYELAAGIYDPSLALDQV